MLGYTFKIDSKVLRSSYVSGLVWYFDTSLALEISLLEVEVDGGGGAFYLFLCTINLPWRYTPYSFDIHLMLGRFYT